MHCRWFAVQQARDATHLNRLMQRRAGQLLQLRVAPQARAARLRRQRLQVRLVRRVRAHRPVHQQPELHRLLGRNVAQLEMLLQHSAKQLVLLDGGRVDEGVRREGGNCTPAKGIVVAQKARSGV